MMLATGAAYALRQCHHRNSPFGLARGLSILLGLCQLMISRVSRLRGRSCAGQQKPPGRCRGLFFGEVKLSFLRELAHPN